MSRAGVDTRVVRIGSTVPKPLASLCGSRHPQIPPRPCQFARRRMRNAARAKMSGALYVSDGELVSELGDLCAAALLGAFGGQRIYVPRAPHPDHPLSQAIGAENAAKVAAMFSTGHGGLWIELPSGRTSRANAARRRLMELAATRLSERQIARELNVHIRTVRRARAKLRAGSQVTIPPRTGVRGNITPQLVQNSRAPFGARNSAVAHSSSPHQITESTSPASVDPFVRALGPDRAVELFLVFGGSVLYLSERPRVGARLLDIVGFDGVQALVREFGSGHVNVPLANAWIAQRLDERGVSRAEIARRLRVSRDRLRRYLPNQGNDRNAA